MDAIMGAGRYSKKATRGKVVTTVGLAVCLAASRSVAQNTVPDDATLTTFRNEILGAFDAGNGDLRLAKLVRLGFHDCVSQSGACDGCIDVNDPENNGLGETIEVLNPICAGYDFARADCYANAASIAVEEASAGAVPIPMPLLFGRTDAASCDTFPATSPGDGAEGLFPGSEDGPQQTFAFFNQEFGFTVRETVAIMGAHTLGRATEANLGHDGVWTSDIDTLDNEFYDNILSPPWTVQESGGKSQWVQNGGGGGGGGGRGNRRLTAHSAHSDPMHAHHGVAFHHRAHRALLQRGGGEGEGRGGNEGDADEPDDGNGNGVAPDNGGDAPDNGGDAPDDGGDAPDDGGQGGANGNAAPVPADDDNDNDNANNNNNNGAVIMLNTDASMFMDPFDGADNGSGEPTCNFNGCPDTANRDTCELYRDDAATFAEDFQFAFVKMVVRGYDICSLAVTGNGAGEAGTDCSGTTIAAGTGTGTGPTTAEEPADAPTPADDDADAPTPDDEFVEEEY